MAKQTFDMHLYAQDEYDYHTGETTMRFRLVPWGKEGTSNAFGEYVGPVQVEADVPEKFDLRAAKLESLRAEQVKVRAEMSARITELQRQINELQALEMS